MIITPALLHAALACQLFAGGVPSMPHSAFGEEGYIMFQRSRQFAQISNEIAFCDAMGIVDGDRVWNAWNAPPAETPSRAGGIMPKSDAFSRRHWQQVTRFVCAPAQAAQWSAHQMGLL